ncbi:ribonuclease E inhibitor RraB [Rhodoferax sp. TH121]|uniref:ribonuclease E inhibitor RraB n=1 Tax=Rhodoferax sp. TH121 TaxID=2022803 RepID=UPI001C3E1645|nr:ribonuclease E inhibitor RraB [Rhodoferax sp. TH121]
MKKHRYFIIILLAFALTAGSTTSWAQQAKRIQLEQLETMFSNIRTKTKWDVDGPLLWGYFFFDQNLNKLKQAASELQGSGYRVVGLEQVEGKHFFRLHVEKVEAHTPKSLYARNNELYLLAERLSIVSYDGMDVGPAPAASK